GGLVVVGIGIVVGAVLAYVPWQYNHLRGVVPAIHDITTDTENPPAFVAAMKLRPAGSNTVAYEGPALAGKQKAAYPDITPVKLRMPTADAFKPAFDTPPHIPSPTPSNPTPLPPPTHATH